MKNLKNILEQEETFPLDAPISSMEFDTYCTAIWDTFLSSDTAKQILCSSVDDDTWVSSTRDDELTSLDELKNIEITEISIEEKDFLEKCWTECQENMSGSYATILGGDIAFPTPISRDFTVDALPNYDDGAISELSPTRSEFLHDLTENTQPLDFSLGSKYLDHLQHPSLEDLPELKPCPIVAAEENQRLEQAQAVNLSVREVTVSSSKKERRKLKRKRKHHDSGIDVDVDMRDTQVVPETVFNPEATFPDFGVKDEPESHLGTGDTTLPLSVPNKTGGKVPSAGVNKKPGRKPGQSSRVYHLWEFLRDLLLSEDYCPTHINWIDKTNGVFKIVKSEEVAKLWGQKKRTKRNMTYEKMSRAIRFSRAAGYFGNLPKDGEYPKKLCFKFGPRAENWIGQLETIASSRNVTAESISDTSVATKSSVISRTPVHWKKLRCQLASKVS